MANTYHSVRPAGLTGMASFSLGGIVNRVVAWNESRRTRDALSRLSTHELDDIGLQRGDIDGIARRRY